MADNIKTFTNDVRAPQADSAGSSAFEIEGRHIESAYAQAGNAIGHGIAGVGEAVEQHYEIQDSANVSKQGAQAFAGLSQSLRDTMANGDMDKADETAANWRDTVLEGALDKIGTDVSTNHGLEMAQRIQGTLREEFTRQSAAAVSAISGQAVLNNLAQTKNGLAQAVSNDPSMLPTALAYLQGVVGDQIKAHAGLSPEDVAQIHREFTGPALKDLSLSAFQTMAERNPEAAKQALADGKFAGAFSGEEIGTMNRYADMQSKAKVEADKAAETEQRRQETEQFNTAASAATASMMRPDGSLVVPKDLPQQIVKMALMPGSNPGQVRAMINMVQTVNKDNAKGVKATTDPQTYGSFGTKMVQGNLSEQEVYEARNDGKLSDKDTSYFLRGIKELNADPAKKSAEQQFNAWANAQKPAFTRASGILGQADPHGMEKWNQFVQAAHSQFENAYSTKGDWQGLLDAKNGNYLGRIAPQYMSNTKGASLPPPPHFTSDAEADKGIAGLKSGQGFIGPDGQLYYKK